MSSSNTASIHTSPHLLYVGHSRSALQQFSALLGIDGEIFETSSAKDLSSFPSCDLAIVVINAQEGVSHELTQWWSAAREKQIPRLIAVTDIDSGEIDFDDIVLIAQRVLDPVLTPYLVLHGDNGEPSGTISLESLETTDYSTTPPTHAKAESDLIELVHDYRTEYLEQRDEYGAEGFNDGLLFPAIPVIAKIGFGKAEILSYVKSIPTR